MNAGGGTSGPGEVSGRGLVLADGADEPSNAPVAAYARYLALSCRDFLTLGSAIPQGLRPAHREVSRVVEQALRKNRRALLGCFASPAVGIPIQCARVGEDLPAFAPRIDQAVAEMTPHLLFEMALRGLIPEDQSVLWEHGAPRLACLALGGELVPPAGATGLRFSHSHVAAIGKGGELARLPTDSRAVSAALASGETGFSFERRFLRIAGITHFATVDHNPIAAFEEHPEKAGNHIDLGGRSETEWVEMLERCFALIEEFLPAESSEMKAMLRQAVPVGYDDHRHLSASYREAIGTIYLTLHPNVMTMTEALIHEFQHNKFNAAAYGAEFMTNAFHPLFKSPVRPDPRPLWGIMLAVHAFLPVAELYRRMRDSGHELASHPEFDRRMSDIDMKNREGMEMLRANAELTPPGRELFDDLERLECRHIAEREQRDAAAKPADAPLA